MKFTNHNQHHCRISVNGAHVIQFPSGMTKDLPDEYESLALAAGLTPEGRKPAKKLEDAPTRRTAVQKHSEE